MAKAETSIKTVVCSCGKQFQVAKTSIASKCPSCRSKQNTINRTGKNKPAPGTGQKTTQRKKGK